MREIGEDVSGATLQPIAATVNIEIRVLCRTDVVFLLLVALLGVNLLSHVVNLRHF